MVSRQKLLKEFTFYGLPTGRTEGFDMHSTGSQDGHSRCGDVHSLRAGSQGLRAPQNDTVSGRKSCYHLYLLRGAPTPVGHNHAHASYLSKSFRSALYCGELGATQRGPWNVERRLDGRSPPRSGLRRGNHLHQREKYSAEKSRLHADCIRKPFA